jgi:predicted transcriptional regulator
MDRNGFIYFNTRLSPKNSGKADSYAWAIMILDEVLLYQDVTDLKENGNQPAEFNVNLITAFKVDVKVSQSYTNETGGKVGGDIVENVVGKDLNDVEKPSDVVENVVENKGNVVENILASISKNSNISTKELAAMCSLSERQVQRIMAKLKKQGVIRRIGPDKGGHWEIIAP